MLLLVLYTHTGILSSTFSGIANKETRNLNDGTPQLDIFSSMRSQCQTVTMRKQGNKVYLVEYSGKLFKLTIKVVQVLEFKDFTHK